MADIAEEKIRLLVKVSTLYYTDGLNQQEIAERLGISRPQVSRMLSAARAEGIVHISIRNPYAEEQQIERAIAETFGIHDVIVLNSPAPPHEDRMELHLARAGAALLESVLKDKDVVGVMAGRTVAALTGEIGFVQRKGMQFVPLVGGWGHVGTAWHANSNARVLGEKLKSRYYLLNAPAIVAAREVRDLLMDEPEIKEVIELAKRATVAVIGIGQVSEEATIVRSGHFSEEQIANVSSLGATANLCTSFIDAQGSPIDFEAETRMIGLSAQEIRRIENVIAIAGGKEKVAAITAALRGRWLDVLITDMETAKGVLEWHRQHPVAL